MEYRTLGEPVVLGGHLQRGNDQVGLHVLGHGVADAGLGVTVDDGGHYVESRGCQVRRLSRWVTCTMGSIVTVGGTPIWCGVGPAGVGTSARRASSASTAVCPSSTAARSSSVSGMAASICCRFSFASSS